MTVFKKIRNTFFICTPFLCTLFLKAQVPGNDPLMQYYIGKNFDQRTFHFDRMLFTTDLSKNFVFHSSYLLHEVSAGMEVINPNPAFKENMGMVNLSPVNSDRNFTEGNISSLTEKRLRGNVYFIKKINNWKFDGNFGGSFYQQKNNLDELFTGFLDLPKKQYQSGKGRLNIDYTSVNLKRHFIFSADGMYLAGKNYFGRTVNNSALVPSFNPTDSNEVYNIRQNRILQAGKFQFTILKFDGRNSFDIVTNIKHYEDSTRNGWQNYSAKQDVMYTFAQRLWKLRRINLTAGISALADKASEHLNSAVINRNLIVPGLYAVAEMARQEDTKLTLQSSLDFHPVFGMVFQPSARWDYSEEKEFQFGIFYNRGVRQVNVIQENLSLISGNRSVILPLDLLQESYHRAGCAFSLQPDESFKLKFVYHYNYFNKYVFADPTGADNTLKFYTVQNNFQKHVFETSFNLFGENGTHLNFKMRNNIFYLYTDKGRIVPYYTPKTDYCIQAVIAMFNRLGADRKVFVDLKINQYIAGKQNVLAKQFTGYAWQMKKFYQMDMELVIRRDGKSYDRKTGKNIAGNAMEFKITWVNVNSYLQKDVFLQSGSNSEINGMQTWANFNPARVCFSFVYKLGKRS